MTTQEIFKQAVDQGKNKNEIILLLMAEHGGDITLAFREYGKLARENGLIMAPKARSEKVNEILATWAGDWSDSEQRADIAQKIADQFDISVATATQHLRDYAEKNNIEVPVNQRTSLEDLVKFVQADIAAGIERSITTEKLANEFGYTPNSAASAYSRVLAELGQTSARQRMPVAELVAIVKKYIGLDKKEAAAKIAEESGYSEATSAQFLTYVPFAEEWLKQSQ